MSSPPTYEQATGLPQKHTTPLESDRKSPSATQPAAPSEEDTRRLQFRQLNARSREAAADDQPRSLSSSLQPTDNDRQLQVSHFNDLVTTSASSAPRHGVSLPVVIPQTSKSFRGAFFSPFVRAYAPGLEQKGISKEDFAVFVDGVNEAFVAHPAFQTLGIVGGVMGAFYGIHPVQWAGLGLQVTSGVASAATSYTRTRAYVKAMNADLFHPAGLHCNIMKTKDMVDKVGYPDAKLQLPDLEQQPDERNRDSSRATAREMANEPPDRDDPCMRRVRALDGYVMPLDFEMPAQPQPDNILRRMGAHQAMRLNKKQTKKQLKDREERNEEYLKKTREAEKKQREGDKEVAKLEQKLGKIRVKIATKLPGKGEEGVSSLRKEEGKIQKEMAKKAAERDKEVDREMRRAHKQIANGTAKEQKTSQKIRWIVISEWTETDSTDSEVALEGLNESDEDGIEYL